MSARSNSSDVVSNTDEKRRGYGRIMLALFLIVFAVGGFIWVGVPILRERYPDDLFWKMAPNEWGDLLAGLFGSLAFIVLALGYASQLEELRLQRRELAFQREELTLQRAETARIADEAGLQRQILEQQAQRADINGRIAEWAFVQAEISQRIACLQIAGQSIFVEGDRIHRMWLRMPSAINVPDEIFGLWTGNGWALADHRQAENLLGIARAYRQFADRVPACGPLEQAFFERSIVAEIVREIECLFRDYKGDFRGWYTEQYTKTYGG